MEESFPKANLEKLAKIKGLGNLYRTDKSYFDESLDILNNVNAKPISLRDLAYSRIKYLESNKNSFLENLKFLNTCFHVKEGLIATPKCTLLVSESPLITSERQKADDNMIRYFRNERDALFNTAKTLVLDKNQVQNYLDIAEQDKKIEPEKRRIYIAETDIPPSHEGCYGGCPIPTKEFGKMEFTMWAFKDKAEDYGLFLEDLGVNCIHVNIWNNYRQHVNKNVARQLFMEGILSELPRDFGECGKSSRRGNSRISDHSYILDMHGCDEWHDICHPINFGGISKK